MLVDVENAVRALHFFTSDDVFNICEAKREDNDIHLDAHEPQAIAECLAM